MTRWGLLGGEFSGVDSGVDCPAGSNTGKDNLSPVDGENGTSGCLALKSGWPVPVLEFSKAGPR